MRKINQFLTQNIFQFLLAFVFYLFIEHDLLVSEWGYLSRD